MKGLPFSSSVQLVTINSRPSSVALATSETAGLGTAVVGLEALLLKPLPKLENRAGVDWLEAIIESRMLVALLLKPLLKFVAAVETDCARACGALVDRLIILPLKPLPEFGATGRAMWGGTLVSIVEGIEPAAGAA